MDTLYRIYTEDLNMDRIAKLVTVHFDGFTIYTATGYWRGMSERSLVVEILAGFDKAIQVEAIAAAIKTMNAQEGVLITRQSVDAKLI